jgi:hypothetical protein
MSDTRTEVGKLITAIEALGYSMSDDMFDFDAVPSSKMNKAYRLEVGTAEVLDLSGRRVEKRKTVDVWAAFKVTAKGDRKDAFLDVLDAQETIEDELLDALTNLPSGIGDGTMSKYVQNYIVVHTVYRFTYWRDLT